jgi:5-methylcytosine-specific restriction endonuclease McrA
VTYTNTYPVEAILSKVQVGRVRLDGDWLRIGRFGIFAEKGIKCVACGLEGLFFRKERANDKEFWHLNLYGVKDGKPVMITRDHIIPRSLGGPNHFKNYQPMCAYCNGKKGNRVKVFDKLAVSWQELKAFTNNLRKIWA